VIRTLAIALLLASVTAASAQEGRTEGERARRPREEIFRMVDDYLAEHLQQDLGLSDDQLERVLPLVRKLGADRRRIAERRIRALHQMRRMVKAGMGNDPRIPELLQQLKAAEAEEPAVVRAGHDAIDALLTPVQQAQFRILEAEIEHRLRQVMARVRGDRRGGAGRPHRGAGPRPSPDPR
jgi:hypothetical protein